MRYGFVALLSAMLATACSESPNAIENIEVEEVQVPAHNYKIKEGTTYGYVSGISDEDRAKGKAASELKLFRYLGEKDGFHTVQHVEEDGSVLFALKCADPCEFMRVEVGGEVQQRIEYNPETLGGGVMQDAMTGKLETADAAPASDPA